MEPRITTKMKKLFQLRLKMILLTRKKMERDKDQLVKSQNQLRKGQKHDEANDLIEVNLPLEKA